MALSATTKFDKIKDKIAHLNLVEQPSLALITVDVRGPHGIESWRGAPAGLARVSRLAHKQKHRQQKIAESCVDVGRKSLYLLV